MRRPSLLIFVAVSAACGTTTPSTTAPAATPPPTAAVVSATTTITSGAVLGVLADMPRGTVQLDGVELLVAIASTSALRSRGLMNVTDLGSLDGMVFVWAQDTQSFFWMKDTLIALDIAWFDAELRYVSSMTMEPCAADPCPRHQAAGAYRYAVEVPAGAMPQLDDGSTLVLGTGF